MENVILYVYLLIYLKNRKKHTGKNKISENFQNNFLGVVNLYTNWGFVMLPHEIGRYYRFLFLKTFGLKLQRPSNGEHITIISPFDEINLKPFSWFTGRVISGKIITQEIYWNGNAIWLNVESGDIDNLRQEIGLGRPQIDLHYCLGYLDNVKLY